MNILILIVFGLCFGSFVNAFVWRLHELQTKKPNTKQKKALSPLNGRSMCTSCRHELAWYDLLPVFSWVSLGGKCRYCHKAISWQYPLVEIATACLFVLSFVVWPLGFGVTGNALFVVWLVFIVAFMALAVYDIRWMELPNKIVYPFLGLGVFQVVLRMAHSGDVVGTLLGALFGFVAIGGLFWALYQISDGKWIGGGDVKLAFVIGPLVASGVLSLMVIFFASLLGTMFAVPFMVRGKLKTGSRIPFGPFLAYGIFIVTLWELF